MMRDYLPDGLKTPGLFGLLAVLMLSTPALARRVCATGDCPPGMPFAKKTALATAHAGVENIVGLTVIVDFPNRRCPFTRQQLDDLLNKPNHRGIPPYYVYGSLRDYYLHVSSGRLDYSNIVPEVYTSKHAGGYFDTLASTAGQYEYGEVLFDEIHAWLKSTNFDFSRLTPGIDSKYRAISIWYWAAISGYPAFSTGKTVPGDGFMRYTLQPIYSNLPAIMDFAHESGHMLFDWPDLYDTDKSSSGIGIYGLMGATSFSPTQPMPPDPYLRSLQGWTELVDLSPLSGDTTFKIPASLDTAYVYRNPGNPGEMFIMENKFKSGWDSSYPQQGIMVWHVDTNKNRSGNREEDMTPERHYMVSVIPSHGKHTLEHENGFFMPDSGLFSRETHDEFSERSLSGSDWWSGSPSCLTLADIGPVGPAVQVTYRQSPHCREIDLSRYNVELGDVYENFQYNENVTFTNLTSETMTLSPISLPEAWTLSDSRPLSIPPGRTSGIVLHAKMGSLDSTRFAGHYKFRVGHGTARFDDSVSILGTWKSAFNPAPDTIRLSRISGNLGRSYLLPENGTASDSVYFLNDLEAGLQIAFRSAADHRESILGRTIYSDLVDMVYDRGDCGANCSPDDGTAKLDLGEAFKVSLAIRAGNNQQLNYKSTLMLYSYSFKFEPIFILLNVIRAENVPIRPSTKIPQNLRYSRSLESFFADVAKAGVYDLTLHDMRGIQTASLPSLTMTAGANRIRFRRPGLHSGVYLARLKGQGTQRVTRLVLD